MSGRPSETPCPVGRLEGDETDRFLHSREDWRSRTTGRARRALRRCTLQARARRSRLPLTGRGVSHAGSRLLADLAGGTTLTGELGSSWRCRVGGGLMIQVGCCGHGGRSLTAQRRSRMWRCWSISRRCSRRGFGLDVLAPAGPHWRRRAGRTRGSPRLGPRCRLGPARCNSRAGVPAARAAGRELPGLVIDLDASILIAHSEKEQAAPTFKGSFGYHPMLAFWDNTGEFLAGVLPRGNAGAKTARRRPRPGARGALLARRADPGPGWHRRLHQGVPGAPARIRQRRP